MIKKTPKTNSATLVSKLIVLIISLAFNSCALTEKIETKSSNKNNADLENVNTLQHLNYLLNISSPEVTKFINEENKNSLDRIKKNPLYKTIEQEALSIYTAKDKLPSIFLHDDQIYNFWQDQISVRGHLRRQSIEDFNQQKNTWEIVLDVDALSKVEQKNWVWKSFTCNPKNQNQCLVYLSDGGKDAITAREFNLQTKQFNNYGFNFVESKSRFSWINENTLFWADATTTQTNSGYAQNLKIIKRGQSILDAKTVMTIDKNKMSVGGFTVLDDEVVHHFIGAQESFFKSEYYYIPNINKPEKMYKLPLPNDSEFVNVQKDFCFFTLKFDFKSNTQTYTPGTVLAFDLRTVSENSNLTNTTYEVVFTPNERQVFQDISFSKNKIWLSLLDDVKRQLYLAERTTKNKWQIKKLNHGMNMFNLGNWSIQSLHEKSSSIYLSYSDFLNPTQYLYLDDRFSQNPQIKVVRKAPDRFDSRKFITKQYKAISKDGTEIPYFVVHKKNLKLNGKNKTLMYGYGGFEYALTQHYLGAIGKSWLSRDGVYVLTNIRGGGEYGPRWHQAALKNKRQNAFDDFISIAEDLIKRKITSAKLIGIQGGSNGGLLTSVMLTQRPDLFGAVISEVPLTNMLEYHKLLAGPSWMDEYGNPDSPDEREYLLKYSPLHNLKSELQYPEAFYLTSTKDDRVHPGHARQMVARLRELNKPVLYFENTDGGHGGAANLKERAELFALEMTYLFGKLF